MPLLTPTIDFYRAADGRRLARRTWPAQGPLAARVVFLHGITSHGGWYDQSGDALSRAGVEVHFLDRRGSGLNAEQPGDIQHWQTWIDDVAVWLEQLRGEALVVLAGISWGGKLAAAVARRHPGLVQALALVCPGLYSPHEPGVLKRLALAAAPMERLQTRRVAIPLRDPALFTETPLWREFIAQDPLALRSVTWRFARQDRQLTRYARQAAPFLHLPLLMMLAGRDRIVNNRRTRGFFARTAGPRRTLIEYPTAGHTLEFEPDPAAYFRDLAEWISSLSRTAPRGSEH